MSENRQKIILRVLFIINIIIIFCLVSLSTITFYMTFSMKNENFGHKAYLFKSQQNNNQPVLYFANKNELPKAFDEILFYKENAVQQKIPYVDTVANITNGILIVEQDDTQVDTKSPDYLGKITLSSTAWGKIIDGVTQNSNITLIYIGIVAGFLILSIGTIIFFLCKMRVLKATEETESSVDEETDDMIEDEPELMEQKKALLNVISGENIPKVNKDEQRVHPEPLTSSRLTAESPFFTMPTSRFKKAYTAQPPKIIGQQTEKKLEYWENPMFNTLAGEDFVPPIHEIIIDEADENVDIDLQDDFFAPSEEAVKLKDETATSIIEEVYDIVAPKVNNQPTLDTQKPQPDVYDNYDISPSIDEMLNEIIANAQKDFFVNQNDDNTKVVKPTKGDDTKIYISDK